VIVDLAAGAGGNTPLSKPDETIEVHGVTIMGPSNLPGALATDASSLYARNLFNFVGLIVDKKSGALAIDWNDEIIAASVVAKGGAPVTRG
jgi:NAD(P) transhydrogenase subunit alpha